jgi:large subunit ribosomal protein L9
VCSSDLLTSSIVGLGGESDQVKVAAGYARNYLFPQRLAIPLTQANKRRLEVLRQRRAEREAHEFNTMSELAKGVGKLICLVTVKTGEDGKMFGAVTSGMIADQLKQQFDISLDKKKIHLEHPIRALGEHEVELHLHSEVKGVLKVRVESSTPLPPPEAAAPAEAKREEWREGRPDRRGRRFEGERPAHKTEGADEKSRVAKGEKGVTLEKAPRPERTPKAEKPGKSEKAPKAEKSARPEKAE